MQRWPVMFCCWLGACERSGTLWVPTRLRIKITPMPTCCLDFSRKRNKSQCSFVASSILLYGYEKIMDTVLHTIEERLPQTVGRYPQFWSSTFQTDYWGGYLFIADLLALQIVAFPTYAPPTR
jgi:hypothetical protein